MDSTLDFTSAEEEEEEGGAQGQRPVPTTAQDDEQLEFGDLSHYFERHLMEGETVDMEGMGEFDSPLQTFDPSPLQTFTSSAPSRQLVQDPSALHGLLEANRRYQEALRDQVVLLEERQKILKESLRWIHSQATRVTSRKPRSHLSSLKTSSASLGGTNGQVPNWHQQMMAEYYRVSVPSIRWSEEERTALAQGIRHQNQGILLDRLLPPGERGPINEPNGGSSPSEGYAQAVRTIQGMTQRQLETNLEGLDWARVARLFLSHQRSAADCRIQWTCNQHPLINHGAWTPEETDHLLNLAKEYGGCQWVEIAEALGTNRTAWQCLAKFRQESRLPSSVGVGAGTGASGGGRKWTAAEDAILLSCVRPTGDWWLEAAERLDGRSTTQIIHRWNKTLDPTRRSGRWSPEEDACLLAAIHRYGTANWAFIGRFVPQRTDMQCRERYMNVLSPSLKKDHFSEEEDQILREAVQRLGEGRWAQISALLPHRTDNQCRRRWLVISQKRKHAAGKGRDTSGSGAPDVDRDMDKVEEGDSHREGRGPSIEAQGQTRDEVYSEVKGATDVRAASPFSPNRRISKRTKRHQ